MSDVVAAATAAEEKLCSNPGCNQPGTKSCSACKTSTYCSVICQTADWAHHKEECDGHLRKVGFFNWKKADGFCQQRNFVQTLRYAEIAATKLKQLKDRRLETVQLIEAALSLQFDALQFFDRHKEAMKCAEERYTLWAMNHMRYPGSMQAALALIQSCLHNEEFEDAENYARHAYFMIAEMTDNFIPSDQYPQFLADVSYWLSQAIFGLAKAGGIPPEQKQKAGEETIEYARKALELLAQLHGTESYNVSASMTAIASALEYFNDVDDDEVLRLHAQAIDIYRRVEGSSSYNVALIERNLANTYISRSTRALAANDLDRYRTNLELSLPHFRESARSYRAINSVVKADLTLCNVAEIEDAIRQIRIASEAGTQG